MPRTASILVGDAPGHSVTAACRFVRPGVSVWRCGPVEADSLPALRAEVVALFSKPRWNLAPLFGDSWFPVVVGAAYSASPGGPLRCPVPGWFRPRLSPWLAIHVSPGRDFGPVVLSVTHVPSGLSVCTFSSLLKAKRFVSAVAGLARWDSPDFFGSNSKRAVAVVARVRREFSDLVLARPNLEVPRA